MVQASGHAARGGSMPRRQQKMPGGRYGLVSLLIAALVILVILRVAGIF